MKIVALILTAIIFISCEVKKDAQVKDMETAKETPSEVKFIDPKGVCNLLSSVGLDQGNFQLGKSESYPNRYLCNDFKVKEMTYSSSGLAGNELQYVVYGSKRGVTDLTLKYRNFAGADKARENEKDIQVFITAANILTKTTLGTELDDLAKKQILETLTVPPQTSKVVYEKNFDRAVLSISRTVNSTGIARLVTLTIFADEYWKDDKNTMLEWGYKEAIMTDEKIL